MLLPFAVTLVSFILAYHYFSPIVALLAVLALGGYYIQDLAKTY